MGEKFPVASEYYRYQLTITKILEYAVRTFPISEIAYRDQLTRSYAQEYQRIQRLSNCLEDLGVKKGDVVATLDWNTPQHYEAYFAVPCMGAILHTLNPRLSLDELKYVINQAEDKFILVNEEFIGLLEPIKDELKTVQGYIVITQRDQLPKTSLEPVYHYEQLISKSKPEYEYPELDENSVAGICFTSGTTGLPKGAYFTHRAFVLHTMCVTMLQAFHERYGLSPSSCILHIVPMFHAWSWSYPYVATLMGCKQVLPGRFNPQDVLKLIQYHKVSHAACVPTVLRMILDVPDLDKYDLSSLVAIFVGGAKLERALAEEARARLKCEIIAGYGLTEGHSHETFAFLKGYMEKWDDQAKLEKRITTGLPVPLEILRVVDEQFRDVPMDGKTLGEIVVRNPYSTPGYLRDQSKSDELWKSGWMRTGDIAVVDEDGYVIIQDRAKDIIKSGGEWIVSLKLEDLICRHPGVRDCAVIGIPDEKWGERPMAVVVPKPEYLGKLTEDEIKNHLASFVPKEIPRWWIPDRIVFVQELPLTSVGKKDKKALRARYKEKN